MVTGASDEAAADLTGAGLAGAGVGAAATTGMALTGAGEATTGASGAFGAADTCGAEVAVVVLVGWGAEVFLEVFFIRFSRFSFSSFVSKLVNARQRLVLGQGESRASTQ